MKTKFKTAALGYYKRDLGYARGNILGVRPDLEGWGGRIYEARTSGMRGKRGRQMSQQELAGLVGVTYQAIGAYELETNWPGWAKWMAMAEALDVTVGWLIAGEHPMHREVVHTEPRRIQKRGKTMKRPAPRHQAEEGSEKPHQRRA